MIATLIGLLPNLIIKIIERGKDKSDINKTSLESADLSMDILQDALKFSKEEIIYLTNQIKAKDEMITILNKENTDMKALVLFYKCKLEENKISLEENRNG